MLSPHWVRLLLVILLGISAGRLAEGSEQMVTRVNATASMYDTRTSSDEDEGKGCYTTGCLPRYTLDGYLNDEPESRWSCSEEIDSTIGECYIVFDLHDSYTLSKIRIYFHNSEDLDRDTNPFSVSTSVDNTTYSYSFGGVNTPGVALKTGENFSFPDGSIGQYIRLTAILDSDQWLSINEVETFVIVNAGAPSPTSTSTIPGLTSTTSESAAPTTLMYSFGSTLTASPTTLDTPTGDLGCTTVTVDNTEGLDGVYEWDSIDTFLSTGINNATIESSQTPVECADTASTSCWVTEWTISSEGNPLSYMAFDDVDNPTLITQVWLRVNCTGDEGCVNSPANVVIACEDGSTSGTISPSPTPVPTTSTNCDIVEVEGTSGGDLDGFYYVDGSAKQGGVTQFIGYDDDFTRNGNALAAEWVTGGCPSPSGNTTIINGDCTWRKWSITPDSDNVEAFEHFTYDEADHPVDIASGIFWYIVTTTEPYEGDITINCAPTDTPALMTPSPSPAPTNISTSVIGPSISPVTEEVIGSGNGSDGVPDNTPAIIGGVVGATVVFGLLGFLWHKRSNTPLPPLRDPPSYDDIMGRAGSGSALKWTAGKG